MGVSSLLIELCESPYISSISSKCFRAGLVRDKLLIANLLAGYQQLSADQSADSRSRSSSCPGLLHIPPLRTNNTQILVAEREVV